MLLTSTKNPYPIACGSETTEIGLRSEGTYTAMAKNDIATAKIDVTTALGKEFLRVSLVLEFREGKSFGIGTFVTFVIKLW